jgi:DNA-binding NarL/FixJ family response regulator
MMRVLLVDDVPEVRVVVRTALRLRRGIEIVGEATTSFSGAQLAADLRPDLVVLDLLLPDTVGQASYLRLQEAAPGSRVVIYSVDDSDPDWYRRNGAVGFVDKDAGLDDLVDVIESAAGAVG